MHNHCMEIVGPLGLTMLEIMLSVEGLGDCVYLYGLTGSRLSCPHAGVTDTSRWLPPPPRPWKKKKKNECCLGARCGCSCVLLRLFGFTLSLPKVARHGDDDK